MIQLKNVSKSYQTQFFTTKVLEDVSFVVEDESIVAITGKSGSGKSTLLNLMCGLDRPDAGQICYDGEDITGYTQKALVDLRLQSCGFVFQDFQLVSTLTAYDNIVIPAIAKEKTVDKAWLEEILSMTGLEGKVDKFPHQLSGGERQRVAIARAIMNRPKVLFADEPTGNLDTENTARIMDFLCDYAKEYKCMFLYVTHDLDLCRQADAVLRVADGRVISL